MACATDSLAWSVVEGRANGALENASDLVIIQPWAQFLHTFRTRVTSFHHNVSAALVETLGTAWQPTSEPVWLLGRCYECPSGEELSSFMEKHIEEVEAVAFRNPQDTSFKSAWAQISRMTYREGFAPMYRCVNQPDSASDEPRQYIRLTSDAGWGCMIRVGQMLLATALRQHEHVRCRVGRDDGLLGPNFNIAREGKYPLVLERRFCDDPCAEKYPFSIFAFVRAAHGSDVTAPPSRGEPSNPDHLTSRVASSSDRRLTQKLPGDWFGPTTISETIQVLVERSAVSVDLAVYVGVDGMLYEDEVRALGYGGGGPRAKSDSNCGSEYALEFSSEHSFQEIQSENDVIVETSGCAPRLLTSSTTSASSSETASWPRAVLLLFPLQLGLGKHASEAHANAVLHYFELRSSLGAMGGRPRMAHYFVGRQGRGLLYVDPHIVQPAVQPGEVPDCNDEAALFNVFPGPFHNAPSVQVIPVTNIDSSISFGFYCQSEADLSELAAGLHRIAMTDPNPLIHVESTRPAALRSILCPLLSGPAAMGAFNSSNSWCDLDAHDHLGSASEKERENDEELLAEEELEACEVDDEGSQTIPETGENNAVGVFVETQPSVVLPIVTGASASLCVGVAWADGAWAEIDEEPILVA